MRLSTATAAILAPFLISLFEVITFTSDRISGMFLAAASDTMSTTSSGTNGIDAKERLEYRALFKKQPKKRKERKIKPEQKSIPRRKTEL